LVWLTAREHCLNANQQWVVVALLKQMGYVIEIRDDEPPQARDEESKALTQALKVVKQSAR
jgi:predicted HD phosphohydrolase